jgi:uncharacterized protein (UPF0261 family)
MPRDTQLTGNQIVSQLAELARTLDATVNDLRDADLAAILARHAADVNESREFMAGEGSVEARKHRARVQNDRAEAQALAAEAVVRYLRNRINAIGTRIDVGRSMAAALRAELAALPGTGT